MDSPLQSRRQVLAGITAVTIAGTAGAAAVSSPVAPSTIPTPPAFRGQHAPKPLSFDPAKLNGLSEKLLVSHHDNNYVGAVKSLNRLEQELARLTQDTPAFAGVRESWRVGVRGRATERTAGSSVAMVRPRA